MRTFTCGILAAVICLAITAPVFAGGYKITKVIEVGPADLDPMLWPLKWSPDGAKLAYFYDGVLNICDTLGKNLTVIPFDIHPHQYEWLSDYELVIHLSKYYSDNRGPQDSSWLVKVDIGSRQQEVLEKYSREPAYNPDDPKSFSGPYLSARGNLFYLKNVLGRVVVPGMVTIYYPASQDGTGKHRILSVDDYYFNLHQTGLYKIRGNLRDSVLVAPPPEHYTAMPATISQDGKYYMVRGTIYGLGDSTWMNLDSFWTEHSAKYSGHGYLYYSFNPVSPEVLFTALFSLDEEHDSSAVGVFDLTSKILTVIDPLIELSSCDAPTYAPDGAKIALLSHRRLYILYREASP